MDIANNACTVYMQTVLCNWYNKGIIKLGCQCEMLFENIRMYISYVETCQLLYVYN